MRGVVHFLVGLTILAAPLLPQALLLPYTRMKADIEFLSSDLLAGRQSLQPGADIAARYIAAEFEKSGLHPPADNSYLQPFPVVEFTMNPAESSLQIVRRDKTLHLLYGKQFISRFYRNAAVRGPVVFAGYGITAPEYDYDDYAGIDVKGKVVLAFDHEPQEDDPHSRWNGTGHTVHGSYQLKTMNAQRHGAMALILVSEPLRKHPGRFDAPPVTADGKTPRRNAPAQMLAGRSIEIPTVWVSDDAAAAMLEGTGKNPGEWQAEIDATLKPVSRELTGVSIDLKSMLSSSKRGESYNVAGLLEGGDGTISSETILVTAHYDHLGSQGSVSYPGANDNASGTAAVMELARLFGASRKQPRRSILFIVFGSEEEMMLGSFYYVNRPLRPLDSTVAAINLDMIARDEAHIPQTQGVIDIPADTSNGLNLVGGAYSSDLKVLVEWLNQHVKLDLSSKYDADHTLNALFRCDHLPFLAYGIPTVWFFGGWHPGYHEPSDTWEKLNFTKLVKVTNLAFLAVKNLADTPQPPVFHAPGGKEKPVRIRLRDQLRKPPPAQ